MDTLPRPLPWYVCTAVVQITARIRTSLQAIILRRLPQPYLDQACVTVYGALTCVGSRVPEHTQDTRLF